MENLFQQLDQLHSDASQDELFAKVCQHLQEQKDFHKLFDARMLHKKSQLGLPLSRPSSLQDVPQDSRPDVEATYIAAAREAGKNFLSEGDLGNAWMYFQVIREPADIAAAIEELPNQLDDYEKLEQIQQIALYEGVNPTKAIKMMLHAHGTCSTITALEGTLPRLQQDQRAGCAKIMVRHLYDELVESVRRHVETKVPLMAPGAPLSELILGRDWLFEGGNYHVDVSHLNAVVRFARSIEPPAEELQLAHQLAQYGSMLNPQLQYGGEPPFADFYPAHLHFLDVLSGQRVDAGLQYFRDQLEAEPDEYDKPIFAYVLVDLLMRSHKQDPEQGRLNEAVEVAAKHLVNVGDDANISFDELCERAGRLDLLKHVRQEQQDPLGYVSALLREKS